MDATRFDTLSRALAASPNRRSIGRALTGFSLIGVHGSLLSLAETEAKRKKKKRRKKRKPTCSDGKQNGSESDVDCGGTCPRCANGQRCLNRDDCSGALCIEGTCQACTSTGQCGVEGDGSSCPCRPPVEGGPNLCTKGNSAGPTVTNCELCPTGTICVGPVPGGYNCTKHCGAP